MSGISFVSNVNLLVQKINIIEDLAKSLTEANILILQKVLGEINLIPIIEDLEKGTYNGGRQIKINLLKNYLAYTPDMTEEELQDIYLDVSNRPEYYGLRLYFTDSTEIQYDFVQDSNSYKISTNVELYEFLLNNNEIAEKLDNTSFFMSPAPVVATELVIADAEGKLSNLLQISLLTEDDGKHLEENPIYDWVEYTSSLQILAQYFSALEYLSRRVDELIAIPPQAEALLLQISTLVDETKLYLEGITSQTIVDLNNTGDTIIANINSNVSAVQAMIDKVTLQTSDPALGNTGDVLTIEVVDGVKRAVYKSLVDASGGAFSIPPATQTTLGGIKAGEGLSISVDGTTTVDPHNTSPTAHANLIKPATTTTDGLVKISDSLLSNSSSTVATSKAVYDVNSKIKTASVSQAGQVQLTTSTNSTSTTLAPTASALKAVNDLAKGKMSNFILEDGDGTEVSITSGKELKFVEGGNIDINFSDTSTGSDSDPYDLTFSVPNASTTVRGAVQLSTSTSSTSTTLAATASAVKQAYDRGTTAINTANSVANKPYIIYQDGNIIRWSNGFTYMEFTESATGSLGQHSINLPLAMATTTYFAVVRTYQGNDIFDMSKTTSTIRSDLGIFGNRATITIIGF